MTRRYPSTRAKRGMTRLERVMLHVVEEANGCWVWTAYTYAGYGRLTIDGIPGLYAHRVSYEEFVGPIPDGLHLDHLCRNRACVNPAHLEPVTPLVNTRRGIGHGTETHCPQGHVYAGDNLYVWTDQRGHTRRYCRACNAARREARRDAARTLATVEEDAA